ncbi:class I adenylate-forming enzyme family protein [Amycolatopsis sp. cg5]|uniref:class I adenylate-forming enzyme family protein n=1 Tax=Amycolatopsis sp. cg5 TaxID=3238802 RepID=UPI0035244738
MRPHDMGTLFDEVAARGAATTVHLDRPLDVATGTTFTVAELAELVREASGWLAGAGVRRGDRVAIVKRNHWDYDLLACAAIRLGALPALISGTLPPEVLELVVNRFDPTLLVTDRDLSHRDARVLSLGERLPGSLVLDDVRGTAPPPPIRRADDLPLVVNHTSGTTGPPKLVVHTTRTIITRLARFEAVRWPVVGIRRDDVVANASAYTHGRTFCWTASVFCRAPRRVVLLAEHDPTTAARMLGEHRPTVVEALPSTYVGWRGLAAGQDNPFTDVRLYVSTYDAMHPPVVRALLGASRRRHPLWMQGWGQTETGPLTFRFLTRRSLRSDRPTTRDLGRPVPGRTRLRVIDPVTLAPVPRGGTGLVLARTRARCTDYVGERDRWRGKVSGAWWNTGDLARRTRTGAVLLLDREVDAIPGLSCLELEDLIEDRLPDIIECVLLGVPGNKPLPVLVTATGTFDTATWITATQDLPPFASPRVLTWNEVPRTGTGKVRRRELLAELAGRAETPGTGQWT